ncbi:MAG: hypothetical protein JWQ18_1317 [Conexibacter sp.]|nr:hypothetical protein [Conexibacter sp.]
MTSQAVDPDVSRVKFDREISDFRALAGDYGRRGWFVVEADFPTAFVVLGIPQLKPAGLLCGVLFDYADYDLRPPSVRFVDPFTRVPYRGSELPTRMLRQTEIDPPPGFPIMPGAAGARMIQQQPLIIDYEGVGSDEPPFLCLAGVREYHDHPAHSGDRWELHRPAGAGRLIRLLEVIDNYAIRPIAGYGVNLVPQVAGFTQNEVPN